MTNDAITDEPDIFPLSQLNIIPLEEDTNSSATTTERPFANPETMAFLSLCKKYPYVPDELWNDVLSVLHAENFDKSKFFSL